MKLSENLATPLESSHWIAWVSAASFLLNLLMLKWGLEYKAVSSQYALLCTGLVYLIQYIVFVILARKMIRDTENVAPFQLFYWEIHELLITAVFGGG